MQPFVPKLLAVLAALVVSGQAHAGYANPSPPAGWGGNSSSGWTFTRQAANAPWSGGTAAAQVTQNVGGRAVTMPASMRLAANAGQYAAAAARLTPGGVITAAVAAWLLTEGIQWVAGQWSVANDFGWVYSNTIYVYTNNGVTCRASTPDSSFALCAALADLPNNNHGSCRIDTGPLSNGSGTMSCINLNNGVRITRGYSRSTCPSGQVLLTTGQCGPQPSPTYRPPTETDWARFNTKAVPDQVANDTPGPLPVQLPNINPNSSGLPQPVTVPTGAPVPVPGTSPQQYKQPVTDIVPSPTQTEPWRVDLQPREVIGTDPAGLTNPTGTSTEPGVAPDELVTCGLPGKPKCLIDEQDTPTPTTPNAAPAPQPSVDVDAVTQPAKDIIENPAGTLGGFPAISWTFALPSSCGPIALTAFEPYLSEINVCQFQDTFHDIMSVVWILGGLFGAISIFWRDQLATA